MPGRGYSDDASLAMRAGRNAWPDCLLAGGVPPRSSGPADPPIGCADIAPDPESNIESNIESSLESNRDMGSGSEIRCPVSEAEMRRNEIRPAIPPRFSPATKCAGGLSPYAQGARASGVDHQIRRNGMVAREMLSDDPGSFPREGAINNPRPQQRGTVAYFLISPYKSHM